MAFVLSACGPSRSGNDTALLSTQTRQIAQNYGANGNLEAARSALAALNVANANQWLVLVAEETIAQGESETADALVKLALDLGLNSSVINRYASARGLNQQVAAPVTEQPMPVPTPTETPAPAVQEPVPPAEESAADLPDADTESDPERLPADEDVETSPSEPTSVALSPVVNQPAQVQATSPMNIRAGPGTDHPIIGALQTGNTANILAKNNSGDWWQITLPGGSTGWIYGALVETVGDTGSISVAQAIPTVPPATTTPVPQPTSPPVAQQPIPASPVQPPSSPAEPPATQAPAPSGMEFSHVTTRLRPVGQDAQSCAGGENSIFVFVQDANGAPLNGVRVQEVFTGQIKESGSKGPGMAQWDIYRGGGGQVQLVDGGGNPISPVSAGMSADWPAFQMMWDGGYCNCKPHSDADSCRSDLENKQYLFAVGHYTYEVIFKRN
ncbi:MAG: SH3 domain-containing protein [Caldilineaceae bacterium]|nr:SH3 domain-containing protein [Caldilineaceae bacterium]